MLGLGQTGPATVGERLEGFLEPLGRGHHLGGLVVVAAFLVATGIGRRQHGFAQAAGFFEHGVQQIARVAFATLQLGEDGFSAKHVKEGETLVVERSLVNGHGVVLRG